MNNAYQHADHTTRMRSTLMQAERRLGLPPCLLKQTVRAKREFRVYSSGIRTGPPRRRAWSAVVCRWTRIPLRLPAWKWEHEAGSMQVPPTGRHRADLDCCWTGGALSSVFSTFPWTRIHVLRRQCTGSLTPDGPVSGPGWCFDKAGAQNPTSGQSF